MGKERVLITGASGFIGRPLVDALVRAGYEVRAVSRRPLSLPSPVETVIVSDLRDPVDWAPILQDIDIVIHLAAMVHTDQHHRHLRDFDQINRLATQNLANAAKKASVRRFVFLSSVRAQMGPSATEAIDEQDEPYPTDPYGSSKLNAERAIQASRVPYTILRPVVVFGPGAKGNVRSLFRIASLPLPLPFKGLRNRRSLLGMDNLISAIFFILNNKTTVDETFLVADTPPLTIQALFSMLRKIQGSTPRLFYFPPSLIRLATLLTGRASVWHRLGGSLVVEPTKLERLGWRPPVKTYEGLRSAIFADMGKVREEVSPTSGQHANQTLRQQEVTARSEGCG